MQRSTRVKQRVNIWFLARRHLKREIKQNWIQGWHYGKGLIYYRPIFRLTKLALLRARTVPIFSSGIVLALKKANFVSRNIGL